MCHYTHVVFCSFVVFRDKHLIDHRTYFVKHTQPVFVAYCLWMCYECSIGLVQGFE